MYDLIIKNACIYDGSGAPAFYGNLAVSQGKIVYVGNEVPGPATQTVDADGLALSPGFIDCHSHSDQSIFEDPRRLQVLRMGVTTELAGQCGFSSSPCAPDMNPAVEAYLKGFGTSPVFKTMKAQIEALSSLKMGTNQRYFTGHGMLRGSAMGLAARTATDDEIKIMQKNLFKQSVKVLRVYLRAFPMCLVFIAIATN